MFNGMIAPLLPMRLRMVWWYQGEANDLGKKVARGGPWWYRCLLPAMIQGWRAAFETPDLPFVYIEICHENGAEEPKELDFWEFGQRAALKLPKVGFVTTTDIDKSALHPPDKQDIAPRVALELQRLAYGKPVVARGPELVSSKYADGRLTITFTNSSMIVHKGVVVPPPPGGCGNQTLSTAVMQVAGGSRATPVPFKILGNTLEVQCTNQLME